MWKRNILLPMLLWSLLILVVVWAWARIGPSDLTTILTIISTLVALLPVLKVGPLKWSAPARPSEEEQVKNAVATLSGKVRQQWQDEAGRRRLQESRQMPVRWEIEDRPARHDQLPAAGQLDRLVDHFAVAPRPMVVTGGPGSGKTGLCVILTLDLLADASRSQVPVLFQVSSWNPAEKLDDWLARRLVEDYDFLGNESVYGSTVAQEIVAQQLVLPVLDGLDEMPAELRPAALKAIDEDWSTSRPFVLTCRTDEFHAANELNHLVGVLVVRLLPLEPQAAANYLLGAAPDTALDDWEPVLEKIIDHPTGPLATTLTKPLMLFLARTAYGSGLRSPRELLDERRFGHVADLEEHLLDRFLPTVFGTRRLRREPGPNEPSRQWDPQTAERTLVFLAHQLRSLGTRDLAWWQLHRVIPRSVAQLTRVALGAVICGLLGLLQFGLFDRPLLGLGFGLAVGIAGALPLRAVQEKRPRRFVPRLLRRSELAPEFLIRDIGFAIVGALAGGLITGLLYGFGYGVLIGLLFGLVFGLARRFTEPTESKDPVSPTSVLASDRSTVLYALLVGGVVGALVGGFLGGVIGAASRGLIFELTPVQQGALGAAVGFLLGAAGLGMVVHATSAWGQFIMARAWLAYRRHTPLHLMAFLEDAHKLGVLRQVGAVYQFRHALLQERLAEWTIPAQPGRQDVTGAVVVNRTGPARNQ